MPLGYPAFRSFHRRKLPGGLIAAAVLLYGAVHWFTLALRDRGFTENRTAYHQVERFIATAVFADAAAEPLPDWFRWMGGISENQLRGEIARICRSAENLGFFPPASYASWALAAHWFGDLESAKTLAKNVSPKSAVDQLTLQLIRGEEPSPNDRIVLDRLYQTPSVDWKMMYLQQELDGSPHFAQRLSDSGKRLIRRNVVASAAFWLVVAGGVVSSVFLLIRRKKAWKPPVPNFRLPRDWRAGTMLAIFLGIQGICVLMSIGIWWLEGGTPMVVTPIIAYLVFSAGPALYLALFFTPGFRATARMFGITRTGFSRWSVIASVFALFLAAWIADYPIRWFQSRFRADDLRDWLHFDTLDSPINLVVSLILAAVIAPVAEEIIYRGFLLQGLRNRLGVLPAIFISTAIFATAHWYSLFGWISVFVFGLLMCAITLWSRSLLPGILAHSLFNLILTWSLWADFSFA